MPSLAHNLNQRTVLLALFLVTGLASAATEPLPLSEDLRAPQLSYENLLPGVDYARYQRVQPNLVYHVVKVDTSRKELRMGVVKADPRNGGNATVSEMATITNGSPAVAVINGDFFGHGIQGPWGPEIAGGNLYYSPTVKSVFLVDSNGTPSISTMKMTMRAQVGDNDKWFPVDGMNRIRYFGTKGFHLYGHTRALQYTHPRTKLAAVLDAPPPSVTSTITGIVTCVAVTEGKAKIPAGRLLLCYDGNDYAEIRQSTLTSNATVRIRTSVSPSAVDAVGGGPRLVRDGQITIEFDKEKFSTTHAKYLTMRHPRSAAGIAKDGKTVYMVIVEGRNRNSSGLAINDLAELMLGLGCWNAMMFDGGGSATLHTDKHKVTNQSTERHVMNGLAVFLEN